MMTWRHDDMVLDPWSWSYAFCLMYTGLNAPNFETTTDPPTHWQWYASASKNIQTILHVQQHCAPVFPRQRSPSRFPCGFPQWSWLPSQSIEDDGDHFSLVHPQLSLRFLNSSPSKIWGLQFRPWRRWRWWWPYRRGGEDTERMASLRAAPSCPCSSAPQVWFRLPLWCWCWCWCWGSIDVSFNLSFSIADWFLMIVVTLRWQLSQTISSPTWPTSQSSSSSSSTPAA